MPRTGRPPSLLPRPVQYTCARSWAATRGGGPAGREHRGSTVSAPSPGRGRWGRGAASCLRAPRGPGRLSPENVSLGPGSSNLRPLPAPLAGRTTRGSPGPRVPGSSGPGLQRRRPALTHLMLFHHFAEARIPLRDPSVKLGDSHFHRQHYFQSGLNRNQTPRRGLRRRLRPSLRR
jgi:hypothetical protein